MVFLYTFLYDVKSLLATGSPTDSSTPGGIDRGVLPSLDGRFEVVEKRAMAAREDAILGAVVRHAGTRKLGRVTGPDDEAAMARPIALPRLGVNMAAIGVEMAAVGVQQYWLVERGWQADGAQLFALSHGITCSLPMATYTKGRVSECGPIADA